MLLTIPETCECKYLRYSPAFEDRAALPLWVCIMCGSKYGVLAIRQRMLEGREVNELEITG